MLLFPAFALSRALCPALFLNSHRLPLPATKRQSNGAPGEASIKAELPCSSTAFHIGPAPSNAASVRRFPLKAAITSAGRSAVSGIHIGAPLQQSLNLIKAPCSRSCGQLLGILSCDR